MINIKYLITYDLVSPGQDYEALYQAIKNVSTSYRHGMQNTWFIESTQAVTNIRDNISPVLDTGDKLFVLPINGWASFNMGDIATWLNG